VSYFTLVGDLSCDSRHCPAVRRCRIEAFAVEHLALRYPSRRPCLRDAIASQIALGPDGVDRVLDPGPSADTPYETAAPFLPRSLGEALQSLRENKTLRGAFGGGFIDYFIHIKEAEPARFEQEVSEWERREYFDLF